MPQSLGSSKTGKKIKGNPPTIWKGSKQIKRINRPAISSFAEADPSLAARLLCRFKQIRFNLFLYLQGTVMPFALLINNPPGAQGKKRDRRRTGSRETTYFSRGRTRSQTEIYSLEFRDLLENCFSNQGADTLIPSFFSRNLRNQARRNS